MEPEFTSNALHIAVPQLPTPEAIPRRSRSPRPIPVPPPVTASTAPESHGVRENHDVTSSQLLAPLSQAELPARSRSPVPRKKVPQELDVNIARTDSPRPASPVEDAEREVDGFVPIVAVPEFPPPSTGANLRRASKTTKSRTQVESSNNTSNAPMRQNVPTRAMTDTLQTNLFGVDKTIMRTMTPPPRAPSRNEIKPSEAAGKSTPGYRATWNEQSQFSTAVPSSPPPPVRPSSPPQPPPQTAPSHPTPQQHTYKQHKREVHQNFRPPTPPITSHYKKKRSYDLLPTEAFASFMKPPVHVVSGILVPAQCPLISSQIYPDASSHNHSLSGESTLNATSTIKSSETVSSASTPVHLMFF